jgi:hypothetical protein
VTEHEQTLTDEVEHLRAALHDAEAAKDGAYSERNSLVAVLSRLYPSHVTIDRLEDPEWQSVICVHTPQGQATWHIPAAEMLKFSHLVNVEMTTCPGWDGHTTEQKYDRLAGLRKTPRPQQGTPTTLQVSRNCEDWRVRADVWHRAESGDWMRLDSMGHPVATLRRIGWLDNAGRVWTRMPRLADMPEGMGSLTPLLIDPGERT